MSTSPYIIEATTQNFSRAVIENSRKVPVLVDFWASWCAPCQMLMPILAKLADEYAGKFLLVKLDTDAHQEPAAQYGVRSLPTVKLFRNGEVMDGFMGAQPEHVIRELLERYVDRASDRLRAAAGDAVAHGDSDAAIALLQQALADDPENYRVHRDLLEQLIQAGQYAEAQDVLDSVPPGQRIENDFPALTHRLEFATQAAPGVSDEDLLTRIEEQPDDLESRYRLASRHVLKDRYQDAMEQFLEIMRRDRSFRDDAGRRGLLAVFEMLDNGGPLVSRYRGRMSSLLY